MIYFKIIYKKIEMNNMNKSEMFWWLVKNIFIDGPVAVYQRIYKIMALVGRSGCWVLKLAIMGLWRSFWWVVGALLRARGVKPVSAPVERYMQDSKSSVSEHALTDESDVSGVSESDESGVSKHSLSGTSKQWRRMQDGQRRMPDRQRRMQDGQQDRQYRTYDGQRRPQNGRQSLAPRRVTVETPQDAVRLLNSHKGPRRLEVTVRKHN